MGLEITDHTLHVSNTIRRIDFLITFLPQEVTIRIGRLPPYLLKLKYGLNTLCFCHFVNAFDFDNIFIHFGKRFFKIKPTHDCSYLKIVLFEDKKIPSLQTLARIQIPSRETINLPPQLTFNLKLGNTNLKLALGNQNGYAYSCSHAGI